MIAVFNPTENVRSEVMELQIDVPREDYVRGWQIETLEGTMYANEGDWIITGIKGEKYPCKPDIFEATYELVGLLEQWESKKAVKVWFRNKKRFWGAIRYKSTNFALGFALDWEGDGLWFVVRLGPLHLDLAYKEKKPRWSG